VHTSSKEFIAVVVTPVQQQRAKKDHCIFQQPRIASIVITNHITITNAVVVMDYLRPNRAQKWHASICDSNTAHTSRAFTVIASGATWISPMERKSYDHAWPHAEVVTHMKKTWPKIAAIHAM
jgi:hypothetical protein